MRVARSRAVRARARRCGWGRLITRQAFAPLFVLVVITESATRTTGYMYTGTYNHDDMRSYAIATVPLQHYWSAANNDTLTVASAEGIAFARANDYTFVRIEGAVFSTAQGNDTVPLATFYSASTHDHALFPDGSSEAEWALANGFTRLWTEGHVFPRAAYILNGGGTNGKSGAGDYDPSSACVPLQQYFNPARHDHVLVVTRQSVEELRKDVTANAERGTTAGFVRIEGCAPLLWTPVGTAPPSDCPSSVCTHTRHTTGSPPVEGLAISPRVGFYPVTGSDTWYTAWALDGHLYTTFTDGVVGADVSGLRLVQTPVLDYPAGSNLGSDIEMSCVSNGILSSVGHAVLIGNDPFTLTVRPLGCIQGSALPRFTGRYPSANLHVDGVWYIGTYAVWPNRTEPFSCFTQPNIGPFLGFHYSTDGGLSWTTGGNATDPSRGGLLGEYGLNRSIVRFAVPHAVDFGQNMEGSPDGHAYIVSHGQVPSRPYAPTDWAIGDAIYLARTVGRPDPATINLRETWEVFAGRDAHGQDLWSANVSESAPLFEWHGHTGPATITYNRVLDRYMMAVSSPSDVDWAGACLGTWYSYNYDTYVLQAPSLTGPWKMLSFLGKFGTQAGPNSKWGGQA